ncbi:hypothetical protein [Novosphingobium album (ex Hu et al. 2023)]|uniref:Nuclear transport factor 2 family protein n=1 Tax=Novosphingobium album (ex Hu et al. 2023) TaxID=2930093 RepID=A0ABT0B5B8_9SPHN|nr:hypothetical protein [Novosphingobium album (ex Hu et al. 2023)]MCJ2180221.1 hypothetical protein [Novosphingobium album (ex Hu et al. 2023)]
MKIATATSTVSELGPLAQRVYGFVDTQKKILAAGVTKESDWDPLTEFIDADKFKRVGAYLEELTWPDYRKFLTGWMAGGTRFEFTEFQISEVGNSVFQEIEERHWRGEEFIRKNVIAVYKFDDAGKLYHLDIYEQAQDSGDWIKESARAATADA